MKNIIKSRFAFYSVLGALSFMGCKKNDVNVSTVGSRPSTYLFDPFSSADGRLEIVGDEYVTLELGQTYVDQGAFVVDSTDDVVDANGNVADSVFSNTPVITPDLTTEGVKTAVYFFRTKDGRECSTFRNIIVYKKPSNPQTNDISGNYVKGAIPNEIVKITDGVYYMKNVVVSTSIARNNVPALFYHTNDTSINIIPQYYCLTTAHQWETLVGTAIDDRMVFLAV
ncbi:MAG: hypothetical protein IPP60_11965 [Sphingobacteriales bacterium]|nr:hypothetical protein [Sphingobacteriales bacterium]